MADTFDLQAFLPYLLNQAAEAVGVEFQRHYRSKYGMLRNEWRVLFHLGCKGPQTAKSICQAGSLHKTKVSRAVRALQDKRMLAREIVETDRRNEILSLTPHGIRVFKDLSKSAQVYEGKLVKNISQHDIDALRDVLRKLATL